MATHNSDVLRGVLDADDAEVTVVRLTREGDVNPTSQLEPHLVRELWSDPLLRYSNLLDGLFHDSVVLCEADSDCRFFGSLVDVLSETEVWIAKPQVLFAHCGGMHRMPTAIQALLAVDVPVRVITDFDILRDEVPLRRIVESLGGEWERFVGDWTVVRAALDSLGQPIQVNYVRQRILDALDNEEGADLSKDGRDQIRALVRPDRGWRDAKRGGLGAVPQGEPSERCIALVRNLEELGLFVTPVGELERWVPAVSGHGPAWVSEVHDQDLHRTEETSAAKDFVRQVIDSLVH